MIATTDARTERKMAFGSATPVLGVLIFAAAIASAAPRESESEAVAAYNRGIEAKARGEPDKAIAEFDAALEIAPRYAAAYRARADTWMAKREPGRAIEDYGRAIAIHPRDAQAHHNRAVAFRAAGEDDRALADYDVALQLDPRNAESWNGRGIVRQAQGHHRLAIADFDRAIEADPAQVAALNNRGVSKRALGDDAGAIGDFAAAIRIRPTYVAAIVNRGAVLRATGVYEAAIADFDAAIALAPASADAHFNRGLARYWREDWPGAARDFERAVHGAIEPYAILWLHLARDRAQRLETPSVEHGRERLRAGWPRPILEYFAGKRPIGELWRAANAGDRLTRSARQCEATFYAAMHLHINGEAAIARDLFRDAKSSCPRDFVEYEGAAFALRAGVPP